MKYRTNKYLTLKGKIEEISLPDSAHGEWIIYDNDKPKFHVNIFNYDSKSDCLVSIIMTEKESEFKNILNDINKRFNRNLTLPSKTFFGIRLSSQLRESDLDTLPFKYVEHYTELIKAPWEKYPGINPDDMFWKMGKGEDVISTFVRYYNSLNQTEKDNFENKYKPTVEWTDFYE